MLWKSTPSLLVCHSIFSGFGVDDIIHFIVVLDPQNIGETSDSSTLGTSVIQCEQNSKKVCIFQMRVCAWLCVSKIFCKI